MAESISINVSNDDNNNTNESMDNLKSPSCHYSQKLDLEQRAKTHPLDSNTTPWYSRALLMWVTPLIKLGSQHPLKQSDVWQLPSSDKVTSVLARENNTESSSSSFGSRCLSATKPEMIFAAVLISSSLAMNIMQPLVIKQMLQVLDDDDTNNNSITSNPIFLVFALGALAVGSVTALDFGMYTTTRAGSNIRSLTMLKVYDTILHLSSVSRQTVTTGHVVTLASLDAERLFEAFVLGIHAFTAPVAMTVTMILVGVELGVVPALSGSALLLLSVILSFYIGKKIGDTRRLLLVVTSERVRVTSEALCGIRVVKMNAWENATVSRISEIRRREIRVLKKFHLLRELNRMLMLITPNFVTAVCIIVYYFIEDKSLTVEIVFSVLAYFNAIRLPSAVLPNAITFLSEGVTSAKRMDEFIALSSSSTTASNTKTNGASAIELKDATFYWKSAREFKLENINLSITPSSLVMVIGPVGSGKSSLLSAILGEMECKEEKLCSNNEKVAYVAQEPWIRNASLRDNILFESAMESEVYNEVLQASHLKFDLEAFPSGDLTEIGEFGINISGGQKARISIARALYHDAPILMLDDPLSALDVHVANAVFHDAILSRKSQTRILVLNSHYHLLPHANKIVLMVDGKLIASGTFEEISKLYPEYVYASTTSTTTTATNSTTITNNTNPTETKQDTITTKLVKEEDRVIGSVAKKTYVTYFSASGISGAVVFVSIVVIFTLSQSSQTITDWYVGNWANNNNNDSSSSNTPLVIYVLLTIGTGILVITRGLYFIYVSMKCSEKLHNTIFAKVLAAPVNTFFDVTPIGRILNRFSRDLDQVDSMLPTYFVTCFIYGFQILAILVVCAISVPIVLALYLPMAFIFMRLQRRYQRSSRALKRLDGISRSPILNLMTETLNGLATVRAFNMTRVFYQKAVSAIDKNSSFFFTFGASGRWLAMRLDWISAALIVAVSTVVMASKSTIDVAVAGLALVYSVQMTTFLQRMVWLHSMTDNTMTSVERLDYYNSLRNEEPGSSTFTDWTLRSGSIKFDNVCMKYRPGLPFVLQNISLDIKSGERIGVVGRTGSGKSSLIAALFRLATIEPQGRILIDDVDTKSVTLKQLRSNISIIPQDPVLFSGTLRSNLDPFDSASDAEIWNVLRIVTLAEEVSSYNNKLLTSVAEKGENLSLGQRQLICIARALLRKTQVVVLDEASANIDMESDKVIQAAIRKFFVAGQTVVCIAHRIETIIDSDRIVVLDSGSVVEFDSPKALMMKDGGHFYTLCRDAKIL